MSDKEEQPLVGSPRRVKKSKSIQDFSFMIQPQLENRSSPERLIDRNIMKDKVGNISGNIQAVQQKLKFQKLANHLHHKLEMRPNLELLAAWNILPIQDYHTEIEERKLFLEHQLELRPTVDEISDWLETQLSPCLVDNSCLDFQSNSVALQHKLQYRPSRLWMIENNILYGNIYVAPIIQINQHTLQFQQTSICLEHKLQNRPDALILVQHNILRDDTNFTMRDDSDYLLTRPIHGFNEIAKLLEKLLEQRPDASYLKSHNILKESHVAPALQARALSLEQKKINNNLNHKLIVRPTRQDLQEHNIWRDDDTIFSSSVQNDYRRNSLDFQILHRPAQTDPLVSAHMTPQLLQV
jgi:hypothetical protein